MGHAHSHLNTAAQLVTSYSGEEPFGTVLKRFFSAHAKYGSRDRKRIASLCYSYFRSFPILQEGPITDRLVTAHFFCLSTADPFLTELRPDWVPLAGQDIRSKFAFVYPGRPWPGLFPFAADCSTGIDPDALGRSLLIQPDLFLRVRPGKEETVLSRLVAGGIPFRRIGDMALALDNGTQVDRIVRIDMEAVVQDLSSQRIASFFRMLTPPADRPLRLWDCCAGSGGKSILAFDTLSSVELTVTDRRPSILQNLRDRFRRAGIDQYHDRVCDLTRQPDPFPGQMFDLVIADVPCTGSGTWGRTPEQFAYFRHESISAYAALQRSILDSVCGSVAPGGWLLYCTCSLFEKENAEQVRYLAAEKKLQVAGSSLLVGYPEHADTLFAALLQRPL